MALAAGAHGVRGHIGGAAVSPTQVFLMVCLIALYFAPSGAAWGKRSFASVFVVNLFFGWTLIGWVIALAWGLKDDPAPARVTVNQMPAPSILCAVCGKYSAAGSQFCSNCGVPMAVTRNAAAG